MARKDFSIYVGTVGIGGAGIWCSQDGGQNWFIPKGSKDEVDCCALAVDPADPRRIYAGLYNGIYRTEDGGTNFHRLESPVNSYGVWSIAVDPTDSEVIFAGCRPGTIFRSTDGGLRWFKLDVEFSVEGLFGGPTRVLMVVVDPDDPKRIWAGVEADGVRRSLDGGDTWSRIDAGITNPDIHGMAISTGTPSTVFVSTEMELFLSRDLGERWTPVGVSGLFPDLPGCRQVMVKPDDPKVVYLGLGDDDNGVAGSVARSRDGGDNWERLSFPVERNSPIWNLAVHPADANLVVCSTHYGQVFVSEDAGDSWRQIPKEFSEIRALAWAPN